MRIVSLDRFLNKKRQTEVCLFHVRQLITQSNTYLNSLPGLMRLQLLNYEICSFAFLTFTIVVLLHGTNLAISS